MIFNSNVMDHQQLITIITMTVNLILDICFEVYRNLW